MPLAGLFDCFANKDTLILACCCAPVLFGMFILKFRNMVKMLLNLGNTAAKIGQTTCLKGTLAMFVPCLNFYCLCQNRKLIREANGVEVSQSNGI